MKGLGPINEAALIARRILILFPYSLGWTPQLQEKIGCLSNTGVSGTAAGNSCQLVLTNVMCPEEFGVLKGYKVPHLSSWPPVRGRLTAVLCQTFATSLAQNDRGALFAERDLDHPNVQGRT
eukprot:GHVN01069880.1.p1 GENE.GHVN01069880.1~~GHVN01069880.1.p1  ORF type:complete len:122 (+),score=4.53 GHVN01069880.1:299-664(+)